MGRNKRQWVLATGAVAAGALVLAGCGSSSASSSSAPSTTTTQSASPSGGPHQGGGSNVRSTNDEGGSLGTVSAVSSTGFTLTTSTGQKVTVTKGSASASTVTNGETVLVLGTVNSQTITASQIIAPPPAGSAGDAAQVVPFQQGSKSASKTIGQVPSNYTEGAGTIMTGSTADQAAEAALVDYPGGIVDRVVQLSGGEYEVHVIGLNWPHHVFVNAQFQVVGAN
jgi:hypothetical protein